MANEFNFKSQICTTVEQSKRLLGLGLKKETADMKYHAFYLSTLDKWHIKEYPEVLYDGEQIKKHDIPAWSLHRLIEMSRKEGSGATLELVSLDQTYDKYIGQIRSMIKEGYFNNEYLKEENS